MKTFPLSKLLKKKLILTWIYPYLFFVASIPSHTDIFGHCDALDDTLLRLTPANQRNHRLALRFLLPIFDCIHVKASCLHLASRHLSSLTSTAVPCIISSAGSTPAAPLVRPHFRDCSPQADKTSADYADSSLNERPQVRRRRLPGGLFELERLWERGHAQGCNKADEEADAEENNEADAIPEGHVEFHNQREREEEDDQVGDEIGDGVRPATEVRQAIVFKGK